MWFNPPFCPMLCSRPITLFIYEICIIWRYRLDCAKQWACWLATTKNFKTKALLPDGNFCICEAILVKILRSQDLSTDEAMRSRTLCHERIQCTAQPRNSLLDKSLPIAKLRPFISASLQLMTILWRDTPTSNSGCVCLHFENILEKASACAVVLLVHSNSACDNPFHCNIVENSSIEEVWIFYSLVVCNIRFNELSFTQH